MQCFQHLAIGITSAFHGAMVPLLLAALFSGGIVFASSDLAQAVNVNTRYEVESVDLVSKQEVKLSRTLQDQVKELVGKKLDMSALDALADRIRNELRARSVSHRLVKGAQPERVRVEFDIVQRRVDLAVAVPRFLYHSKQGWTGEVEGAILFGPNKVAFAIFTDGDEFTQRNEGIVTRYENRRLGSDRVGMRFQFESYRQRWNNTTQVAAALPMNSLVADSVPTELFRTRQNLEPVITLKITPELELASGFSFQFLEFPAARTEASNAVVNSLRYHRQWEAPESGTRVLDAGYTLRAATSGLGSDYEYIRHRWNAGLSAGNRNHVLLLEFRAGLITGTAPLYERFVLGNSNTLRGWNKYDLAPLGASRMVHQSVEYRYRFIQVFYDTGTVWSRKEDPDLRQSAGLGLRKGAFSVAVAFPLRDGRVEPVILAGMNF